MGMKNFNFNYTGHNMCWHRISRSYLQLLQPTVYTGDMDGWVQDYVSLCHVVPGLSLYVVWLEKTIEL